MEGGQLPFQNWIQVKNINGFKGNLHNSIFMYVMKRQTLQQINYLIYPAGNRIVVSQLSSSFQYDRVQDSILKLETTKGLTCITQSPSKRYLAWAQQTDNQPIIIIEDLKKDKFSKRRYLGTQLKSKKYISLSFNGGQGQEPKTLVALTGPPDYSIVQFSNCLSDKYRTQVFLLERVEKTEMWQEKFNSIFFFPKQDDFIVVTGKSVVKTFKLSNQGPPKAKDSPFSRGKDLSDKIINPNVPCIVNKQLILGTEAGELLYITSNCQYKCTLNNPSSSVEQNLKIQTMIPTSKGFLIGTEQSTILIYQRPQTKGLQPYIKIDKKIQIKQHLLTKGVNVTSLLLTPKEQFLFVGLSNNQVYKVPFADRAFQQVQRYDSALQKFHSEAITGMDVCLRKPYVATCSSDRTIKLWNYSDRTNLQISAGPFEQKAVALTLHPSGLHMIVAFPDKIKLFNIFQKEIIHYKQIPQKNSTDVKFSNGGHLFAVVNNVTVHIYRYYTGQQPKNYQLNTLAQNTAICWQQDDQGIFVATSQCSVLYHRFDRIDQPPTKIQIFKGSGLKIITMACLFNVINQKQLQTFQRIVYFSGIYDSSKPNQQKFIYEVKLTPKQEKDRIDFKESKYTVKTQNITTMSSVSKIAFLKSNKIFLYCTMEKNIPGCLRICKYPFTGDCFQIQCHSQPITKICVTFDDGYVFTGGKDGLLVTYEVKEKQARIKLDASQPTQHFLILKSSYMQKKQALQATRRKRAQQNQKRMKARNQQIAAFQKQREQLNSMIEQKMRVQNLRCQKQKAQIYALQQAHKQSMRMLGQDKNRKYQALQKDYQQKLKIQEQRYKELKKNGQNSQRKYNQKIEQLKKKQNQQLKSIERDFQAKLQNQRKAVEFKKIELDKQEKQFEQVQRILQADNQKVIYNIKKQAQKRQKELKQTQNKALAQNATKRKDHDGSITELHKKKVDVKHVRQAIKMIRKQHQNHQLKKLSLAKQIQQRTKTIQDKMTRIHELKKKKQELQKFKFVLDYKIRQLKRDVGPKEEQIAKMNEQINNMTSEIQHFNNTNEGMRLIVKDLRFKKQGMLQQIRNQTQTQQKCNNYIRSFQADLSQLNMCNEYKQLKKRMIELYRKYVEADQVKKRKQDNVDQQRQFIKQRAHLETTVKGHKDKFQKNLKAHKKDNQRMMNHNEQLIYQTNELIRRIRNLQDQQKRAKIQGNLLKEKDKLKKEIQEMEKKIKEAAQRLNRQQQLRPQARDQIG